MKKIIHSLAKRFWNPRIVIAKNGVEYFQPLRLR
jgi:hypothetical protein